jgi:hypothetical protein
VTGIQMTVGLAFELVQAVGVIATAIGVVFAWTEIRRCKKQTLIDFEDEFSKEYRQMLASLPTEAFVKEELDKSKESSRNHRTAFFCYFDLCNEQVFLRQNRRISRETWLSWCSGIRSNLRLPAFNSAWSETKAKTELFAELRKLEESDFKDDPLKWGKTHLELESQHENQCDRRNEESQTASQNGNERCLVTCSRRL